MALKEVLKEQIERNQKNLSMYMKRLNQLPKGTVHPKIINGNKYYYLKYRDENGKRVDKYIKKDELEKVKKQLRQRENITRMIKELRNDIKIAESGLKYKDKESNR